MTYDFEKLINAALAKGRQNEGETEEVQETQENEKPTETLATSGQQGVLRMSGNRKGVPIFPNVPTEIVGKSVTYDFSTNYYVDASIHIEQNTVNNTSNRKETVIGVGDNTVRGIIGMVAGICGLLKG